MPSLRSLIPLVAAIAAAPLAISGATSANGSAPPELVMEATSGQSQAAEDARDLPDQSTSEREVVRLNPKALDSGSFGLNIDGRHVVAERTRTSTTATGSTVWAGRISATNDDVTLVRKGSKITASVRVAGDLYQIRPGAQGSHVITKVDQKTRPPEHPDVIPDGGGAAALAAGARAGVTKAPSADAALANSVIRVLVVASSDAVSAAGGSLQADAELAVAETNTGYANSGIPITMELAGYQDSDYRESGSFDTDLARLRGTSDGYLDDVHTTRNNVAADVNVLLVKNGSYCGLGYLNATASTAFSTVNVGCATGYYSFGHEIGHNQGAQHDPANDSGTSYNHGYQYSRGGWRTIMAYDCSPTCLRLNYWSNPNKTLNGVPMGTTSLSNNARKLTETASTVAAFR